MAFIKKSDRMSPRLLAKKIANAESKEKKYQELADRHKTSDYLIWLILRIIVDISAWAGFILLGWMMAPIALAISGYVWLKRDDLHDWQDFFSSAITAIIKIIPGVNMIPAATFNAIHQWNRSYVKSTKDQAEADKFRAQAERLKQQQRKQMISRRRDTNEPQQVEETASEEMIDEMTAKKIFAGPQQNMPEIYKKAG